MTLSTSSGRNRRISRPFGGILLAQLAILWLISTGAIGQEAQPPQAAPPAAAQASSNPASEMSSRDEVTTFKVKVNLVLVRVVVRDGQGNPVGGLHQEDFQVFDNGKLQSVRQFSAEGSGVKNREPQSVAAATAPSTATPGPKAPVIPTHFVAYVFDDVHAEFGDLVRVRQAATQHIDALQPTDRAAIFTTSGQGNVDFTDDRAALHSALDRIRPTVVSRTTGDQCPDIGFYQADLIQNRQDENALNVATADALACAYDNNPKFISAAQVMAQSTAARVLMEGEHESRLALGVLRDVLRRISAMPGQRTILVLSPGFLTTGFEEEHVELIDKALRAQVVVSTLNARGLYAVDPLGDITKRIQTTQNISINKVQYDIASNYAQEFVLRDLADGTGGTYYHNSNDLYAGMQRIAATPEFYYVLGFSPLNLKLDGHFHKLKVEVKNPPKLSIQARQGYYAPKHAADPAEAAKQEIEDALFSQEELHDLPIDLHTQFFKASDTEAQLAVLVHIDARHLHFNRDQDRNANQLTIVSGLFDRQRPVYLSNRESPGYAFAG